MYGLKYSRKPYTAEGIGSIPYLRQCIEEIIRLIDYMVDHWPLWEDHLQVRAGIAAWDATIDGVGTHDSIDLYTYNNDFSSDIFARAQFFAEHGYA